MAFVQSTGMDGLKVSSACHFRYFMRVVAVIGPKLCDVPPSLVQVGLNWLSCLVTVRQAINMRKTKLTNNKNV